MHKGSGVFLLVGYAVHFCGIPLLLSYAVHFCGIPLSVGYAVHFCGVPLLLSYAVHFCGVPLLAGYAVHFCGIPLLLSYAVHFCGIPLSVGYAVHFCGVPLLLSYAVHFCGVFAAAQKLLLVNLSASTLKSANHRPNTLRQRFKHLNHQMNMIRHHLLCKHLQGKPLRSVKLRQATQNLIYTIAKGVKLNESPFRTLALQCSKKRKAPLNGEGKMIDGTTTIVPPVFTWCRVVSTARLTPCPFPFVCSI